MADVLKEFLVKIGFHVDGEGERKLNDSIGRQEKRLVETEKAASTANRKISRETDAMRANIAAGITALAATAAAVAATTTAAMVKIAAGLEQVSYASQRTKASADNLKAFQYAASQLGSTAEEALGVLEEFGSKMRSAPGFEDLLKSLGVETRDGSGKLKDMTENFAAAGDKLSKMPDHMAKAYSSQLGLSDKMMLALRDPKMRDFMNEYIGMLDKVGTSHDKNAKAATPFMAMWRKMGATFDMIAEKVGTSLIKTFGGTLDKFVAWLLNNAGRISDVAVKIGEFAMRIVGYIGDLFSAFDKMSPGAKDMAIKIAALAAAFALFSAGPLGAMVAITAALVAFVDDAMLKKLGDMWDKFDALAKKLTGHDGMTVAFAALGAVLALKVLAPLTSIMTMLTGMGALKLPPWLLGLLGVGALAGAANANGILGTGEGSRSTGERIARFLEPGAADRAYGKTEQDKAADAKDNRTLYERWAPKILGGKEAPSAGTSPQLQSRGAVPGSQGGREQRAMARLIGHGWTPEAAATAVGQAVEESSVRSDGPLGDTKRFGTGDAAAHGMFQWRDGRFRALKKFAAEREKDWKDFDTQVDFFNEERKSRSQAERNWHKETDLGEGNKTGKRFEGYAGGLQAQREAHARRVLRDYRNGRAAPIPEQVAPVVPPTVSNAIPKIEGALQNFNDRFNDSMGGKEKLMAPQGKPLGSWSTSNVSSTTTNSIAPVNNIRIDGSRDPVSTGKEVERAFTRTHADLLRNLQGNVA